MTDDRLATYEPGVLATQDPSQDPDYWRARYESTQERARQLLDRALAAEVEIERLQLSQRPRSFVVAEVLAEADRADQKHGRFASTHETYGVLKEEVDEFFDTVKRNEPRSRSCAELIQVAAVALRAAEQLYREGACNG